MKVGENHPRSGQPGLVAEPAEHLDRGLGLRGEGIQVDPLWVPVHLDARAGDGDAPLHTAIAGRARARSGVGEHGARLVDLADLEQCIAQLGQRRDSGLALQGGQRGGAAEQVHRSRHVSAPESPLTSGGEMVAGPMRELELRVADGAELGAVSKRLLEVIADNLRVLSGPAAGAASSIHLAKRS